MPHLTFAAPLNCEAEPVLQWIELATSFQIPSFQIIGLPGPEVAEARERVRAAMEASGFDFPRRKVVLNLSPASIRKRGTGLDLAMALGVISSTDERFSGIAGPVAAWGELGLDGMIKPAGQITRAVYACWKGGIRTLVTSRDEFADAIQSIRLLLDSGELSGTPPKLVPANHLMEACSLLLGHSQIPPQDPLPSPTPAPLIQIPALLPLSPGLERVLGISAAGGHHLLLLGPRGAGKSHALEWLLALRPAASAQSRLHSTLMSELRKGVPDFRMDDLLPARRVGSQVRPAALLGTATGTHVLPGEFSLADGGLLIADEIPEWSRDSRECLREPLERGVITLTRTLGTFELPARFTLIATGNLCPCGGWPPQIPLPPRRRGNRSLRCKCSKPIRTRYLDRLSGPVLDRLDLVILVAERAEARTRETAPGSPVESLRKKVLECRNRLIQRWGVVPSLLSAAQIEDFLDRLPEWRKSLDSSSGCSLRGRHKTVRVALTLAEWDGHEEPSAAHLAEASFYRPENTGLLQ